MAQDIKDITDDELPPSTYIQSRDPKNSAGSGSQPQKLPYPCKDWNDKVCNRTVCKFTHACYVCSQQHPAHFLGVPSTRLQLHLVLLMHDYSGSSQGPPPGPTRYIMTCLCRVNPMFLPRISDCLSTKLCRGQITYINRYMFILI